MIVIPTTGRFEDWTGYIAYGLLVHDKTDLDYRRLHRDTNGNPVFRGGAKVLAFDSSGGGIEAAEWVDQAMEVEATYGLNQKEDEVYAHTYTISWHPEDRLTEKQIIEEAKKFTQEFLVGFPVLVVVHSDTQCKHVHITIPAWREQQVPSEMVKDWMRRDKEGKVLPSEMERGAKHHRSQEMFMAMNDFLYREELAHGWTVAGINNIIAKKSGERYDDFTRKVREVVLYAADCSQRLEDTIDILSWYGIDFEKTGTQYILRNKNGWWSRTSEELGVSWLDLYTRTYGSNRGNMPSQSALTPDQRSMRSACLLSIAQSDSAREVIDNLDDKFGLKFTTYDGEIALQRAESVNPTTISQLDFAISDFSAEYKRLSAEDRIRTFVTIGDAFGLSKEECETLLARISEQPDPRQAAQEYRALMADALDLFWQGRRKLSDQVYEEYRARAREIYRICKEATPHWYDRYGYHRHRLSLGEEVGVILLVPMCVYMMPLVIGAAVIGATSELALALLEKKVTEEIEELREIYLWRNKDRYQRTKATIKEMTDTVCSDDRTLLTVAEQLTKLSMAIDVCLNSELVGRAAERESKSKVDREYFEK